MIWFPVLIAGSVLYAGNQALRRLNIKKTTLTKIRQSAVVAPSDAMHHANQELAMSAASLSVAAVGSLLKWPVLGWVSFPVSVYLFIPVIREAGRVVGKERRINDQVLTTGRLAVCAVMGYTFIAALDAGLHALTHRLQVRQEEHWLQTLRHYLGKEEPALVEWLHQNANQVTLAQQQGERSGATAAPLMLLTCVATTPLLGINRSAAFLTTFFGAHLRKLGPYTAREFMSNALAQGVVITHPRLLDQAAKVDTVVVDAALLLNPLTRESWQDVVHGLMQQQYAVYVVAQEEMPALTLEGVKGWFSHTSVVEQTQLIQQWQAAGQTVAYVSSAANNEPALQVANVAIMLRKPTQPMVMQPGIVLPENELSCLIPVFALAKTFTQRQQFNLLAPIGVDLVDISTTLFLDFGLIYSVMFTYTGLLLGMKHATLTTPEPNAATQLPVPALMNPV